MSKPRVKDSPEVARLRQQWTKLVEMTCLMEQGFVRLRLVEQELGHGDHIAAHEVTALHDIIKPATEEFRRVFPFLHELRQSVMTEISAATDAENKATAAE